MEWKSEFLRKSRQDEKTGKGIISRLNLLGSRRAWSRADRLISPRFFICARSCSFSKFISCGFFYYFSLSLKLCFFGVCAFFSRFQIAQKCSSAAVRGKWRDEILFAVCECVVEEFEFETAPKKNLCEVNQLAESENYDCGNDIVPFGRQNDQQWQWKVSKDPQQSQESHHSSARHHSGAVLCRRVRFAGEEKREKNVAWKICAICYGNYIFCVREWSWK